MECSSKNLPRTVFYAAHSRLAGGEDVRPRRKQPKWSPHSHPDWLAGICIKVSPKFNLRTMIWFINECIFMP